MDTKVETITPPFVRFRDFATREVLLEVPVADCVSECGHTLTIPDGLDGRTFTFQVVSNW